MATFNYDDWFSHAIPVWEAVLSPLKGARVQALEIGSFEGRSAVWLLSNILTHEKSTLTCVDPFKPYSDLNQQSIDWEKVKEQFFDNIEPWGEKVNWVGKESTDFLKQTPTKYDLIYVDGAHTSAQCLIDSVLCHLLLKPGGIIIFDDYMWSKLVKVPNVPKAAIDAFMECFAEKYEVLTIGYQVILKKKEV